MLIFARAVVLIAATALAGFAVMGLFSPRGLAKAVRRIMDADRGVYVAVGLRLVLGVAMLASATSSRYPTAFTIVGWIAIVAAVAGLFLGRQRLKAITEWWLAKFTPLTMRAWLIVALAFAAFLAFGVV